MEALLIERFIILTFFLFSTFFIFSLYCQMYKSAFKSAKDREAFDREYGNIDTDETNLSE